MNRPIPMELHDLVPRSGEVWMLGLAVGVAVLLFVRACLRRSLPRPLLYLAAGILAGPHGIGLLRDPVLIRLIAEGGALLLLFLAATHLRLRDVRAERRVAYLGLWQGAATLGVVMLPLIGLGVPWRESLFTGAVAALGSAALPRLRSTPGHGRRADAAAYHRMLGAPCIAAVVLLLFVPLLGDGGGPGRGAEAVLMVIAFLTLIHLFAQERIARWLAYVARRSGRDGYVAAALGVGLSVGVVGWLVGLGAAVGAFFAGLMLSESTYRARRLGELTSLQGLAGRLFLLGLGLLLDLRFLVEHLWWVIGAAGTLYVVKSCILRGSVAATVPSFDRRLVAQLLVPPAELSFLLLLAGREAGLAPFGLEAGGEQLVLAGSALLLACFPWMASAEARIARWIHGARAGGAVPIWERQPGRPAAGGRNVGRAEKAPGAPEREITCRARLCLITVEAGAPAAGQSVGELLLRQRYGVVVLGVWRRDVYLAGAPAGFLLEPGDALVLGGAVDRLVCSLHLFRASRFTATGGRT